MGNSKLCFGCGLPPGGCIPKLKSNLLPTLLLDRTEYGKHCCWHDFFNAYAAWLLHWGKAAWTSLFGTNFRRLPHCAIASRFNQFISAPAASHLPSKTLLYLLNKYCQKKIDSHFDSIGLPLCLPWAMNAVNMLIAVQIQCFLSYSWPIAIICQNRQLAMYLTHRSILLVSRTYQIIQANGPCA